MNSISEANKHLLDMMYCAYMRVYASTYHLQLSTCVLIKKPQKTMLETLSNIFIEIQSMSC